MLLGNTRCSAAQAQCVFQPGKLLHKIEHVRRPRTCFRHRHS